MRQYVQNNAPNEGLFLYHVLYLLPSKNKTFVYYVYNVGPTSKTLGQNCTDVIQMSLFTGHILSSKRQSTTVNKIYTHLLHIKLCSN